MDGKSHHLETSRAETMAAIEGVYDCISRHAAERIAADMAALGRQLELAVAALAPLAVVLVLVKVNRADITVVKCHLKDVLRVRMGHHPSEQLRRARRIRTLSTIVRELHHHPITKLVQPWGRLHEGQELGVLRVSSSRMSVGSWQ